MIIREITRESGHDLRHPKSHWCLAVTRCLELDYSYDDFESMFKFNNPKAKSTCGCGTSFSVGM